jgi:hypothetical protein
VNAHRGAPCYNKFHIGDEPIWDGEMKEHVYEMTESWPGRLDSPFRIPAHDLQLIKRAKIDIKVDEMGQVTEKLHSINLNKLSMVDTSPYQDVYFYAPGWPDQKLKQYRLDFWTKAIECKLWNPARRDKIFEVVRTKLRVDDDDLKAMGWRQQGLLALKGPVTTERQRLFDLLECGDKVSVDYVNLRKVINPHVRAGNLWEVVKDDIMQAVTLTGYQQLQCLGTSMKHKLVEQRFIELETCPEPYVNKRNLKVSDKHIPNRNKQFRLSQAQEEALQKLKQNDVLSPQTKFRKTKEILHPRPRGAPVTFNRSLLSKFDEPTDSWKPQGRNARLDQLLGQTRPARNAAEPTTMLNNHDNKPPGNPPPIGQAMTFGHDNNIIMDYFGIPRMTTLRIAYCVILNVMMNCVFQDDKAITAIRNYKTNLCPRNQSTVHL